MSRPRPALAPLPILDIVATLELPTTHGRITRRRQEVSLGIRGRDFPDACLLVGLPLVPLDEIRVRVAAVFSTGRGPLSPVAKISGKVFRELNVFIKKKYPLSCVNDSLTQSSE